MKNLMIKLVALIGICFFVAGTTYAAPSDCGDDSVKPINVQSTTSKNNHNT